MLPVPLSAVMRSRGIGKCPHESQRWRKKNTECLRSGAIAWNMRCLRLFFAGSGRQGVWVGPGRAGTFLAWSLTPSNLLLHLCLHLSNSKTLFVAPMELQFHTLSLSLFMLFPLNLPFLPMTNYCLSSQTKLRCLLLQTGFQNLPDVHTFFLPELFGVVLCKRTGSSVKAVLTMPPAPSTE